MKLTIRTKLLGGFAAVLVLLGVVAWVSIRDLGHMVHNTDEMYSKQVIGLNHIMQAIIDLVARGRAEKNMILAETDAEIVRHHDSMIAFLENAREELVLFETVLVTAEGRHQGRRRRG